MSALFYPQIAQIIADYFLRGWAVWRVCLPLFYPQITRIIADYFLGWAVWRRGACVFALFYPQITQIHADYFLRGLFWRVCLPFLSADYTDLIHLIQQLEPSDQAAGLNRSA
ncbi:MAG: hypothetical protein ACOX9E_01870 [Lentisphaeria bacterium]